jgi:hypothetical protein
LRPCIFSCCRQRIRALASTRGAFITPPVCFVWRIADELYRRRAKMALPPADPRLGVHELRRRRAPLQPAPRLFRPSLAARGRVREVGQRLQTRAELSFSSLHSALCVESLYGPHKTLQNDSAALV